MANLKQAFEYASQNPDSDFAKNLEQLASSGSLDGEAKKYGIDLTPFRPAPTLASKLGQRAKDFGKEVVTLGTLGANTVDPNTIPENKDLATIEGLTKAGVAPVKMLGALGGAVGDVVGAGLQATGLDKPLGEALAPIAQSDIAQKAVQAFQSLPPEYQDYLKSGMEATNLAGLGATKSLVTGTLKRLPTFTSASEVVNVVPKNLTQKAVDLISSDPSAKVETILKRATPDELNNYLNIAKSSAVSGEAKTVLEAVGDKLSEATKSLETKLGEIGKAKSDIILPLREGLGSFKVETQPFLDGLTKLRNSFSEVDKGSASIVDAIIADAKTISTKIDADKFIDKIQDAIYSGNRNMTLVQGSAVDKQLRGLLGKYNNALKASLPNEYSVLNKRYSDMIDTLSVINRSLGEVVEGVPSRGAGLVKQYFSPAGSKTKEIFEFIKKETNGEVDLAKDVTLAKFAGQLYDDVNVNSLLGGIKDIPTTLGGAISKVVEKVGGEKVTNAMRESTIRKAKEISSPKSPTKSGSKTINQPESKLPVSSPQSTPTTPKSKGIRGFVSLGGTAKLPVTTADVVEPQMLAKTKTLLKDIDKEYKTPTNINITNSDVISELRNRGYIEGTVDRVSDKAKLKTALDDMIRRDRVAKVISNAKVEEKATEKAMSTQFVRDAQGRFDTKKKVVSSLEQDGVPVFRGQSHEGLTAFDNKNTQRFLPGMDGTSFSLSKDSALNYGDKIVEGIVPNNTILRMKDLPEELKIYIKSEVKKLTVDDYIEGTAFEKIVSSLAGIAKGRKKNAIDLTEFFPKSKIDDEIRVLNKDGIKVTPKLSHLEQEAKKYKSAEEFVKAQGKPLMHGGPEAINEFMNAGKRGVGGVYLTPDTTMAKIFAGKEGKITDAFVKPKKVFKIQKGSDQYAGSGGMGDDILIEAPHNYPYEIKRLKAEGYDAIRSSDGKQLLVLDPSQIKTKSQLTDIWKKANGK